MCGAFVAFAVADSEGKPGQRVALNAAYHDGRLLTYVWLGIAAGSVGALLDLSGALVGVSRIAMSLAGAVMVLFGLSAAMAAMGKRSLRMPVPAFMQKGLSIGHRAAMQLSPVRRALTIGLLTTLLPCGCLYAFAAVAGGTASPLLGGLTRAVLEALRLGRPVVGYDHGGVGEVLAAVYHGGLTPLGDIDALADRLSSIVLGKSDSPMPGSKFLLSEMLDRSVKLYESARGLSS